MKMQNDKPSGKQPQKITVIIVAIVLIAVALIVAGVFIFKNLNSGEGDPSSLPSSSEQSDVVSEDEPETGYTNNDEFDSETGILTQFVDMHEKYPDFIGHLTVPGTLLDTDVVLGKDNSFYLDRDIDGAKEPYGTPFIDYRATFDEGFQSTVLTIYGHNSSKGDYFESVKDYANIDYYKENPLIEFDTIYGTGVYKVIGRFTELVVGDSGWWRYHDAVNLNEESLGEYLKELDKRNYYDTDIDVEFGDQFIVLSTCNDDIQGPLNTPYRDVLVARKVRIGEELEVNVDNIKPNEDMVMPAGWVKKYGKDNPYK